MLSKWSSEEEEDVKNQLNTINVEFNAYIVFNEFMNNLEDEVKTFNEGSVPENTQLSNWS